MSYRKRLDNAFDNAPVLPLYFNTKYVFFSDCHRGVGDNNDNFIKNANNYLAALQYYNQYGFHYIEVGDGDELWENKDLKTIIDVHNDVFSQLCRFHKENRLHMLYGNHDMVKKDPVPIFPDFCFYESVILSSENPAVDFYVTHGHQADLLNSVFWKLARLLVRYLWTPLENFGVLDPTSASKNNKKKDLLEKKYLEYAKENDCHLLAGHSHRAVLGTPASPYHNCGSCTFPKYITCIELCGYNISLVKWYSTAERSQHFGSIYSQCPPTFPVYIKREVLASQKLI